MQPLAYAGCHPAIVARARERGRSPDDIHEMRADYRRIGRVRRKGVCPVMWIHLGALA